MGIHSTNTPLCPSAEQIFIICCLPDAVELRVEQSLPHKHGLDGRNACHIFLVITSCPRDNIELVQGFEAGEKTIMSLSVPGTPW